MGWNDTPEVAEAKRRQSIEEMRRRDAVEWDRKYQEMCDALYWSKGQCCAGCDHWESHSALWGRCKAAQIVSGADVLRSLGVTWSSYIPSPGHPYTRAQKHCGLFKDDFDWSTLPIEYLKRIGATDGEKIKEKPTSSASGI